MENKFISLLKTLEKNELRAFKKYFKTLYSGQKAAIVLLEYLEPMHPDFEHKTKLEGAYIQKRLTKKLGTTAKPHVANTFSDLYLYLKKYLLWQKLEQPSYEQDMTWIKILNERKLYEKASRATDQFRNKLEKNTVADAALYLKKMQAYDFESHNMYNHKFNIGTDNLESCLEYLDLFYATTHLKYSSELLNRGKVFKVNKEIDSSYALDIVLRKDNNKEQILIIYSKLKDLLLGSQTAYDEIEKRLFKYKAEISLEDQNAIITYLLNFIMQNKPYDEQDYFRKMFSLYDFGFNTRALVPANLSIDKFINIVAIACGLREFDWILNLIESYKSVLNNDIRDSTISLAKAHIAYNKKDMDGVFLLLQNVDFGHSNNEFRARLLLLRTYVNKEENIELIFTFCRSFKRFLIKEKFSKSIISPTNNLINIVELLYKKTYTKKVLKKKIETASPIFHRHWLLEKLERHY